MIGYNPHMIDMFDSLTQLVGTRTKKRKQSSQALWVGGSRFDLQGVEKADLIESCSVYDLLLLVLVIHSNN